MIFKKHDSDISPFSLITKNIVKKFTCPNFSNDIHITFEDYNSEITDIVLITLKNKTKTYGLVYVVIAYTYTRDNIRWTYVLNGESYTLGLH